jgi:type II secretory pathway pseudopilin PulG
MTVIVSVAVALIVFAVALVAVRRHRHAQKLQKVQQQGQHAALQANAVVAMRDTPPALAAAFYHHNIYENEFRSAYERGFNSVLTRYL